MFTLKNAKARIEAIEAAQTTQATAIEALTAILDRLVPTTNATPAPVAQATTRKGGRKASTVEILAHNHRSGCTCNMCLSLRAKAAAKAEGTTTTEPKQAKSGKAKAGTTSTPRQTVKSESGTNPTGKCHAKGCKREGLITNLYCRKHRNA